MNTEDLFVKLKQRLEGRVTHRPLDDWLGRRVGYSGIYCRDEGDLVLLREVNVWLYCVPNSDVRLIDHLRLQSRKGRVANTTPTPGMYLEGVGRVVRYVRKDNSVDFTIMALPHTRIEAIKKQLRDELWGDTSYLSSLHAKERAAESLLYALRRKKLFLPPNPYPLEGHIAFIEGELAHIKRDMLLNTPHPISNKKPKGLSFTEMLRSSRSA